MKTPKFRAGDRVLLVGNSIAGTVVTFTLGRIQSDRRRVLVLFDENDVPLGVPPEALVRLQPRDMMIRH